MIVIRQQQAKRANCTLAAQQTIAREKTSSPSRSGCTYVVAAKIPSPLIDTDKRAQGLVCSRRLTHESRWAQIQPTHHNETCPPLCCNDDPQLQRCWEPRAGALAQLLPRCSSVTVGRRAHTAPQDAAAARRRRRCCCARAAPAQRGARLAALLAAWRRVFMRRATAAAAASRSR